MDKKIERSFYEKNKSKFYTILIISIILISTIIYGSNYLNTLALDRDKIQLATVEFGDFQEFIPIDAKIVPLKTIFLDAVAGGQVEKVYVEDGAILKKGDPILKLSNTTLVLDVMYREAQLFEQENQLRNTRILFEQNRLDKIERLSSTEYQIRRAKRNFKRDSALFAKGVLAKHELDLSADEYNYQLSQRKLALQSIRQDSLFRKTQIVQLENSVRRLKSNFAVVKETLDRLTVTAPMDGQLTAFDVQIGQSIRQEERIAQIDLIDQYKADALIDEHYLPKMSIGQKAIGFSKAKEVLLELSKIFPLVENGRVKINLKFTNTEDKQLTRGQRLQLKLELGESQKTLLLKRGSFYNETGGTWAFVRSKGEKYFSKRQISLSRQNPLYFEVSSGLKVGDELIISDYSAYKEIEQIEL